MKREITAKRRPWNKGKKLTKYGNVKSHRRRVNPRKRRKVRARRRANPTHVLLANPQRRRRRRARRVRHASHVVRTHVTRSNPRRRRRSVRHIMRSHGIRRRANPMLNLNLKSAGTIFRYALFGGAGVMVARFAGTFYSRNIASFVLGDAANDPKSWRQILNEAVRLAVMAGASIALNRVLKGVKGPLTETDRQMLLAGGLAETGRQALGVIVKRIAPDFQRGYIGLDGPQDDDGMLDESGRVWVLRDGEYHLLEGVEDADSFAGVEEAEAFAGGFN